MTLKLVEWNLSKINKENTIALIQKLRSTSEKWHLKDGYCHYLEASNQYTTVGIGLRLCGVGVLTETQAHLKWPERNYFQGCFDIDFDEESERTKFSELYGWYHLIEKDEVDYGLDYLDGRMLLTFSQIAAIIQGCLDGKETVKV